MRTYLKILFLIFALNLSQVEMRSTVDIYLKSVKFSFNKMYQKNMKFEVKTSRAKPTGVLNFSVYQLKPVLNPLIDLQLYYRYGTVYRNYLFSKEGVEACELFKDIKDRKPRYQNPLANLFQLGIKQGFKQLARGCPYPSGWYNGSNIDINGTVSQLLPTIVPAGNTRCMITYNLA